MTMSSLVKRIEEIPAATRVRILYEAIPWKRRKDFERKIMDPAIKPIRSDMAVLGPAYTVADPYMSFEMVDDITKKDCVMVVQTSGCQGTFVGAFMRELIERGGVVVHPGDIIVGNLDGVMVLNAEEANELVDKSQWFTKVVDNLITKYMDKGIRFTDVPGVREYWVHKTTGSKNEDEFYREWCEKYAD